ncbi:MAG: hypothetical protein MORG_02339 [Morganella sp. (in: enterobacteria)]
MDLGRWRVVRWGSQVYVQVSRIIEPFTFRDRPADLFTFDLTQFPHD